MGDINFDFWKMAYNMGCIDESTLAQAVKCTKNPFGEITPEQYKEICEKEFIEQ